MADLERLEQFCRKIADGAAVVVARHPGCGAVAGLVYALRSSPVPVTVPDGPQHDEDAQVEAYAEVHRLTAENAALRARIAELEQGALFSVGPANPGGAP